jgi:signal transduction histidine kinase
VRWPLRVWLLLIGLLQAVWLPSAGAYEGEPALLTISRAQAVLEPDGAPAVRGEIDLAQRWDQRFPGRGGRANYLISLPPQTDSEPMALLFSRVGNQVQVQVNGQMLRHLGVLGDPRHDAAKSAVMVRVPAALLHANQPNELQVELTLQPQRLGGLSVLRYGPESVVTPIFNRYDLWRNTAMAIYAAVMAGMGLLGALMWWRQRDALYGWFSLAALTGAVRNLDRIWPDLPLPWPWLGALVWICFTAHIALSLHFVVMVVRPRSRLMDRAVGITLGLDTLLIGLAFALGEPRLLTVVALSGTPLALLALAVLGREALARREATAWVLLLVVVLATGAGLHDAVLIRLAQASGLQVTLTQHGMFAFVLIMAVVMAERYNRAVAEHRTLNTDLARRIGEREGQLQQAFEALQAQRHQQSVAGERQRIMRDIHDGVGAQLVGLLSLVDQPDAQPAALREQVQLALDEMRAAVDSLQPSHDDLVTLLATLRWRLQARLQASGIAVVWDVDELPALQALDPHTVLNLQRILLEAFTNLLKHARATQVTVQARWLPMDPPRVGLRILDNGVGLATAQPGQPAGQGLVNMRARAQAIGADLVVGTGPDGGVCVALQLPVERDSSAPVGA